MNVPMLSDLTSPYPMHLAEAPGPFLNKEISQAHLEHMG